VIAAPEFVKEQAAKFLRLIAPDLPDMKGWTALDHAIALEAEIGRDRAQAPHFDHQPIDKYRCVCPDGHSLTIEGGDR